MGIMSTVGLWGGEKPNPGVGMEAGKTRKMFGASLLPPLLPMSSNMRH
jgi:hypothetical protein